MLFSQSRSRRNIDKISFPPYHYRGMELFMTEQATPTHPESSNNERWPRMTKDEINTCPIKRYEGPICLVQSEEDLARAVRQLKKAEVLGFDTETRPTFRPRQSYLPTVLQLADDKEVFIFQLKKRSIPPSLLKVLTSRKIVKAGVALDRDLIDLNKLTPFKPAGFVDVGELAKAAGLQNHGLRGLAAVLLGFRISKRAQTSNWAQKKLSQAQIHYAATDAWVGRELYFKLQDIMA